MKKVSRIALIISGVLLAVDVIYVINHLQTMNILNFLGMVVLLPCVFISLIIASLIAETHFREVKQQGLIAGISGVVIAVLAYVDGGSRIRTILKHYRKFKKDDGIIKLIRIRYQHQQWSFLLCFRFHNDFCIKHGLQHSV